MITLKNIKNGQQARGFNTDLFQADLEIIEDFNKDDYQDIIYIDSRSTDHELSERYLGIKDNEAYLITARATQFNGETQITRAIQWLTLKGFNWIIKPLLVGEEHLQDFMVDFYNSELKRNNFDIGFDDVILMATPNPQFNCSILELEDDNNNYYITINQQGLLSKITKKMKTTNQSKIEGGLL
jgi:hypothetical protein